MDTWRCALFVTDQAMTVVKNDVQAAVYDLGSLAGGLAAGYLDQVQLCT